MDLEECEEPDEFEEWFMADFRAASNPPVIESSSCAWDPVSGKHLPATIKYEKQPYELRMKSGTHFAQSELVRTLFDSV